jgi:hypothetical protein
MSVWHGFDINENQGHCGAQCHRVVSYSKKEVNMRRIGWLFFILLMPVLAWAEGGHGAAASADLTGTVFGYLGIIIFVLAYALVPLENSIHLRKSKPVLLAAGLIWVLLSIAYIRIGDTHTAHQAIKHSLLEYAELFLFLLAAMTYINAMEERNVFQSLRAFLVSRGFSLRSIFWDRGIGISDLTHCRQPDDGPADGGRGHGRGRGQQEVRGPGLHQRGGRRQRRRRFFALRGHYHPDGLAEREGPIQ